MQLSGNLNILWWPQDWKRSSFIPIPKKGNLNSKRYFLIFQFSFLHLFSKIYVTSPGILALTACHFCFSIPFIYYFPRQPFYYLIHYITTPLHIGSNHCSFFPSYMYGTEELVVVFTFCPTCEVAVKAYK